MNKEKKSFLKTISELRLKKSFVGLFFVIISLLSYQILYLYILFIVLAVLFSILGIVDKQKIGYIIILLALLSLIGYFAYYKPNYGDPNGSKNILVGTWNFDEGEGSYIFNEDKTYYQYATKDKNDNFCKGKYTYTYGYEDNDGKMLLSDEHHDYYTVIMKPSACTIMGESSNKKDLVTKKNIFGYAKYNVDDSAMQNTMSEEIILLHKDK